MTFGGKQEERKRLFRNKWCTEKGKKKLSFQKRERVYLLRKVCLKGQVVCPLETAPL